MNTKITAIGEALVDIYGTQKKIGGAPFNFIYHVNKLLGTSNFVIFVGDDVDGRIILKEMKSQEISQKY